MANAETWHFIWLGVALVLAYEAWFRIGSRRAPLRYARATHARLRAQWVTALLQEPGRELLAVQTIRNSVLSATLTASTAVLALMGAVALLGGRLAPAGPGAGFFRLTPAAFLTALLIVILAAAFAFSAMAVRFYNHSGYLMTTPADGETRERLVHMACNYMMRAGNYYSMGLRTLFWLAPVAVGLVNARLLPLCALVTVGVLVWFDRTPEQLEGMLPGEGKP